MFDWEKIIQILLISWLIINQTYIQKYINTNKIFKIRIMTYVKEILTCFVCTSFWIGLIFSLDIYTAILCSFIAYVYNKIENQIGIKF